MEAKKEICLVTWVGSPNFGTNLQAYALQQYLNILGYHVCILQSLPLYLSLKDQALLFFHNLAIYKLWLMIKKHYSKATAHYYALRFANPSVQKWAKSHLRSIKVIFRFQLRKLVSKTDCFIAGSDQIWNSYASLDPTMYLAFAGSKKRISYASSLGTSGINPKHSEQIKRWLSEFSHISVREPTSVPVLQKLTSRSDIVSVLDPTFLLSAEEWTNFAIIPERYKAKFRSYIL